MAYGITMEARAMDKTTLYLPADMKRELKAAARRSGRAQADIVREALARYLANQPRQLPQSIGMISDGTLDAAHVKDWLRANWMNELEREMSDR
jgi:hypothetical protein